MWEEIIFEDDDRIAVIAPHPDDECLGAAAALLLAPAKTDIYVLTDGSHGGKGKPLAEEARIRRRQFEAEMAIVKPHAWFWLGLEDTTLSREPQAVSHIDFTPYTKIFIPWSDSLHPDHRAAADMCRAALKAQKSTAECFSYEVSAPFRDPTHYIDITGLEQQKRQLVRCHADQAGHEQITLSLNAFRAAQIIRRPDICFAEAYLKIDVFDGAAARPCR